MVDIIILDVFCFFKFGNKISVLLYLLHGILMFLILQKADTRLMM